MKMELPLTDEQESYLDWIDTHPGQTVNGMSFHKPPVPGYTRARLAYFVEAGIVTRWPGSTAEGGQFVDTYTISEKGRQLLGAKKIQRQESAKQDAESKESKRLAIISILVAAATALLPCLLKLGPDLVDLIRSLAG